MKKLNKIYQDVLADGHINYQLGDQTRQLDETINTLFYNINPMKICKTEIPFKGILLRVNCDSNQIEINIIKNDKTFWIKTFPPENRWIPIAKQQLKDKINQNFDILMQNVIVKESPTFPTQMLGEFKQDILNAIDKQFSWQFKELNRRLDNIEHRLNNLITKNNLKE